MKINVQMTRAINAGMHGVDIGDVVALDLETYLMGVLPSEIYESRTPMEAKKAQAIAARTYAVRRALDGETIIDTPTNQSYNASKALSSPSCAQAVEQTRGLVLTYGGEVIRCYYSASNGGATKRTDEVWQAKLPYYEHRDDPWDTEARAAFRAQGRSVNGGHGVGLSQIGAEHAAQIGESCADILAFYYPGTKIVYWGGPDSGTGAPEAEGEKPFTELFATENPCYKAAKVMQPVGIVVHSTGANNPNLCRYVGPDDGRLGQNKYKNHWNQAHATKCVHAFIGKLADGTVAAYQTLPWTWRCWGAGKGSKGSANADHIQFEICEDGLGNAEYYRAATDKAAQLCAWLCVTYGISPDRIVGHYEAHKLGYANNHADPQHWMRRHGDSMDAFRQRVAALIARDEAEGQNATYTVTIPGVDAATATALLDSYKGATAVEDAART